jgi:O-antigen/teichoic acid export membrane protein
MKSHRIIKTGAALFSGQGVTLCTQLLLPPLFLHYYGVARYGEWLALAAAVNYLGSLNFGLQTYANNQVSIALNRNEFDEVNTLQATAFAILLGIVGTAALAGLLVFVIPLAGWLNLQTSPRVVSLTAYLLGLQVLGGIIFGFITGSFLVGGISYRGMNWYNARSMASLAGTAIAIWLHASFPMIAALQLGSVLLFSIFGLWDLRVKAPIALPKLRYIQMARVPEILRPSAYFAMLFSSNFLAYQLPVILMQRILGPTSVVVFSISRTIYSMSRSMLTALSSTISPEIVELYGQSNWPRLSRLYELSERLIFALTPIISLGTFMATPILLSIWAHKPGLYDVDVCIYMTIISAVMGIKEHKYQFQTSSNQHAEMARFIFVSYVGMVTLSAVAMPRYGVPGFLALWLLTELIQTVFIVRLNRRLFAHFARLDLSLLYRLLAMFGLAMLACGWLSQSAVRRPLGQTAMITGLVVVLLASISYPLFGIDRLKRALLPLFGRWGVVQVR